MFSVMLSPKSPLRVGYISVIGFAWTTIFLTVDAQDIDLGSEVPLCAESCATAVEFKEFSDCFKNGNSLLCICLEDDTSKLEAAMELDLCLMITCNPEDRDKTWQLMASACQEAGVELPKDELPDVDWTPKHTTTENPAVTESAITVEYPWTITTKPPSSSVIRDEDSNLGSGDWRLPMPLIVGIAIGGVVFICLFIGGVVHAFLKRRRLILQRIPPTEHSKTGKSGVCEKNYSKSHEISCEGERVELPAGETAAELWAPVPRSNIEDELVPAHDPTTQRSKSQID